METDKIENKKRNAAIAIGVLGLLALACVLALVFGTIPPGTCPGTVCPFG